MGATNGLDLSPDGKTLYVSESNKREIWRYRIDGSKLVDHKMIANFPINPNSEVDGLRTDVDGRIFLARLSAGKIAILMPDGTPVREVTTTTKGPNNLTFGGPDGRTVFVTQSVGKYVESFRTDRPGREPCMQVPSKC
jgi:signal peptidase